MLRRSFSVPSHATVVGCGAAFSSLSPSCASCLFSAARYKAATPSVEQQLAAIFSEEGQRAVAAKKAEKYALLSLELRKLNMQKAELDARSERRPNAYAAITLAYLTLQSAVLFHWVYQRFDWTLCEPITYLLGTAVGWLAVGFYLVTGGEFEWEVVRKMVMDKQKKKLYAAEKFDVGLVERMQRELELLQMEIAEEAMSGKK